MEEVIKKKKIFPWLRTFLDKFMKNFPDCSEDLLQYLLENLDNEVKAVSTKHDRKRLKALFETVLDLYLHFWWKIRWKGEKMWRKYWEKDYSKTLNYDFRTKCVAKLLYFIIYIGIILSKGVSDSNWISRTLQAMQVLPDYNIVCTSLLVQKLKKKYRRSYCAILKNVLITKVPKCILDPVVYIKIMILFRRLKMYLEDVNEKREIQSAILKFQAPSSLIPWMTSFNLDVSKVKHKNIAQQLFKKSSRDLFQKLQLIVADFESLSSEERSKDTKHTAENIDSQMDMESTLNVFHSSRDLKIEEKKSISPKMKKLKSKKKRKRKSKSGTAVNLDERHSLAINEKCNENVNLGLTPSSPTAINGTSLNLDDTNSLDMENLFEAGVNNSTQVHSNLNHPFSKNSLEAPILYKETSVSEDTCDRNENYINTAYDETIDHLGSVASQTSHLLQSVNITNPDSQITDDNLDLCRDDSVITREEHFNLKNNADILEQLCTSFNSVTNLNSNSNADSVTQNVPMERIPYIGGARVGFSESQNLNETGTMCKNTVEVGSNELTFPQREGMLHQSTNTTCDGNTFVIDCNFLNNASDRTQSETRLKNPEISSIKVIINLNNKKHSDSLLLQNEHHAGNFQLTAKSLSSNASANSFTDHFNDSHRTASSSQVVPQYNGYHSPSHEINSLEKPSGHMQHKIATPPDLLSSTPHKRSHKSTSTKTTFNNTQVKTNYLFSPPKNVPSTSQRRTSTDGSEFYTPHKMCWPEDIHFRSTPILTSLQNRYVEEHLQSAPNSILAFPGLQDEQHEHYSRNDFSQCQAANNFILSKNGSKSGKTYRNSATEIYSDVSCDNFSVSTMAVISDEETDHSFIKALGGRSSSESPLKNKDLGSNNHSRMRTISASSIECHSNAENNCHKNKKVYFCNLNGDKTNNLKRLTSKCRTSNSIKTRTVRRKANKTVDSKKKLKPCAYNLRSRKRISMPSKFNEYILQEV